MKTLLTVFTALLLLTAVTFVLAVIGLALAGVGHVDFNGQPLTGAPRYIIGTLGLVVAAIAVVFALAVAAVAVVGAMLAVFAALVLTGLILLAVALPFLLPLIILLAGVFVLVLVARHSSRRQAA
jgi:hypothetical protein